MHTSHAQPPAEPQPQVLLRREGSLTRITLNRPRAINALSHQMVLSVRQAIIAAGAALTEADGDTTVLLDGAGDRGFCGGGDVKALASMGHAAALEFLQDEYRADYAISRSRVPVVGIMDGITMGGGIGLTGHAGVRVVTERSRLAMPETRIGIVPDVGVLRVLARAPGRLGELIAAAALTLSAGDAIACGLADYFVPSERLEQLRVSLARGKSAHAAAADLAETPPESPLLTVREWFDPIAEAALNPALDTAAAALPAAGSVLEQPATATRRLVAALERSQVAEARSIAQSIRSVCPSSVAITLARLHRIRLIQPTLAEVLAADHRTLGRLISRPDFVEGVRAQLIDKDRSPTWRPESIDILTDAEMLAVLAPELADHERALLL